MLLFMLDSDFMATQPTPTERELEILKIIWQQGEATVREVHKAMSKELPIVQNTVQAFLCTMEEKGLVQHRVEGRTFIYRALIEREQTNHRLASRMLQQVFDGAIDQLVQSVFSVKKPTAEEIARLEALIADVKSRSKVAAKRKGRLS